MRYNAIYFDIEADILAKKGYKKAIIRTDSVKRKGSDYQALAPQTGLEPVTPRLTAACSTD